MSVYRSLGEGTDITERGRPMTREQRDRVLDLIGALYRMGDRYAQSTADATATATLHGMDSDEYRRAACKRDRRGAASQRLMAAAMRAVILT